MIDAQPVPAHLPLDLRPELVTASYAHLGPAGQPSVTYAFTEQPTFWNRPDRAGTPAETEPAASEPDSMEAAATWWPVLMVVLVAAVAGLALFGSL